MSVTRRQTLSLLGAMPGVAMALGQPIHKVRRTDVVVIGSGAAGLAAAIEARKQHKKVILIEKMGTTGGNSSLSAGAISVPNTPLQTIHGITDSVEQMVQDIMLAGYVSHRDRVRTLCQNAYDTWRWTEQELGVKWHPRIIEKEYGHSCARTLHLANRSGSGLIYPMTARAQALGVEIRLHAAFTHFLQNQKNRIIGVRYRNAQGDIQQIMTKCGVVLASGGFGADPSFSQMQNWRLSEQVGTTNQPGATSETIREAYRVGAWVLHAQYIHCIPETSPDENGWGQVWEFTRYCTCTQGIWVVQETGKRFVNELESNVNRTNAILDLVMNQQNALAIADAKAVEQPSSLIVHREDIAELVTRGFIYEYETLRDLAVDFSIPLTALQEEIEQYNQDVQSGVRLDSMSRPVQPEARPMSKGPWYVSRVLPKVMQCTGGVVINTDAQVLSVTNDQPIPNLYAAGEITGGIHGISQLGAMGLIDALVFGRIAGQKVCQNG